MKKIFLLLLIVFMGSSSYSFSKDFDKLFGLSLFDYAEKYFDINIISSTKYKTPETIDNYFNVNVTDLIKNKSPQIEMYKITIDNNNQIHSIFGIKNLDTITNCKERVAPSIKEIFESKYFLDFSYFERFYTDFNTYGYDTYDGNGSYFRIQCNKRITGQVYLQIFYQTKFLLESMREFYDQGF